MKNKIFITFSILIVAIVAFAAPTKKFFQPVEIENLKLEGNTITSTNTNGDININANGTGDLRLEDQVGINGAPHASALFQVSSTTQGSVPAPKMTEAQRDLISSPTSGLVIFNTDTNTLNVYTGVEWTEVGSGAGGGAGSFELKPSDSSESPSKDNSIALVKWVYTSEDQGLWGVLTIPSTYKLGDVVSLEQCRVFTNSTDTSKIMYMKATVYVFRNGSQAPTSLSNALMSDTSTAGSFTSVPSNANYQVGVGVYLTDSLGRVDGVGIHANDVFVIKLSPNHGESDSFTGTLNLIDKTCTPNFKAEWL